MRPTNTEEHQNKDGASCSQLFQENIKPTSQNLQKAVLHGLYLSLSVTFKKGEKKAKITLNVFVKTSLLKFKSTYLWNSRNEIRILSKINIRVSGLMKTKQLWSSDKFLFSAGLC